MYSTMSRAVASGPVGQPTQCPQIAARFSFPLRVKSSKYFSTELSNWDTKTSVYPSKYWVLATNQRAVLMSPSFVVIVENDSPGGLIQPPGASAFVNATRSASGFKGHMPVNSETWFPSSVCRDSPGYRRPH